MKVIFPFFIYYSSSQMFLNTGVGVIKVFRNVLAWFSQKSWIHFEFALFLTFATVKKYNSRNNLKHFPIGKHICTTKLIRLHTFLKQQFVIKKNNLWRKY